MLIYRFTDKRKHQCSNEYRIVFLALLGEQLAFCLLQNFLYTIVEKEKQTKNYFDSFLRIVLGN